MNKKQKMAVAIAVALVVLNGVYPPYVGEYIRGGDNPKKYLGYHSLFAPPSEADVFRAIRGGKPSENTDQYTLSRYSARIVTSRVWVQIVTIVIATTGIVLILSDRKQKGFSNAT